MSCTRTAGGRIVRAADRFKPTRTPVRDGSGGATAPCRGIDRRTQPKEHNSWTGEGGYSGRPVVVATGNTVAVAFYNGTTWRLKISTNNGASWMVDTDLATGDVKKVDGAAASGKVAFAWLEGDQHIYLRRFNGTTLGSKKRAVTVTNTSTYKNINHIAVAMSGTSVIGVAYNACSALDCSVSSTKGTSIRWAESRDSGAHWASSTTIGSYTAGTSRRNNE